MTSEARVTIVRLNDSKSNSSIESENTSSCPNNDDRATNDTVIEVLK